VTLEFTADDYAAECGMQSHAVTYEESHNAMHTLHRKCTRRVPAFALNNNQIRAVLLHASVRYAFRRKKIPPHFEPDLATVVELAKRGTRKAKEETRARNLEQKIFHHIACVELAGGRAAFLTAISWRAWRLNYKQADIAEELGVTTAFVGGLLRQMIRYAAELGFETRPPHPNKGRQKKVDHARVQALWSQGLNCRQIAEATGHQPATVRHILNGAGINTKFHQVSDAKKEAILKMWQGGATASSIVRELKTDIKTVRKVIGADYVPRISAKRRPRCV
jgi:hypothetical protein